ncbi:CobW family GTP-binding protein [Pseudomonas rubra]|uniref:CobW family GTP-binding protein n=1 Tax=Pseudomonas rubra TaxID=2942627 RepID=A0ABT5PD99_9PSED|nr:CobW family GTP-binding protein [Pseudomonas rubra]MDD1016195.1 CobW family GTP-binding protein [Pseudomonas rubra]MDD1039882.1 CobW family GTP-binding protein [Pseudomonas rubra]MDD1156181.1 CobW family GTP-binding protein [Pseudomonas rubra]
MLQNIPTHVIAGPLGAGKTSLIRQLLAQRPADERWAVLINEFGQIGLDAALLTSDDDGIALAEVAGGCLCCVNGMPFQVGLGRLLRKARPHRVFIEPSGLGHPLQLLEQLRLPPWQGVLAVQPAVLVLDAEQLAAGFALPEAQQSTLASAGLLVMNKSADLDAQQRLWIASRLADVRLYWTDFGQLPFSELPVQSAVAVLPNTVDKLASANVYGETGSLWTNPQEPICSIQQAAEGWSIGWCWHPSQVFDCTRLALFLNAQGWRRAKAVIHSMDGWQSLNAVAGQPGLDWGSSEWRRDSRLELIFAEPQDPELLKQAMLACRV